MSQRSDIERLADMRSALADIQELTEGGLEVFMADRKAQQALAYNLAVLGEAARALSPGLRERYPQVPWRGVIGQRNVVIHAYHRIDPEILWKTATQGIRHLDQQVAEIERTEQDRA